MPPMHTPDEDTLDALYAALDYNHETGELIWLKSSPRVSEGTPAGTLNRVGRLVIGFQGKQYPAGAIAWFIHSQGQEWPSYPVVFKDGDPVNLAEDNLKLAPQAYSHNRKAQQMRVYRAKVKERHVERLERSSVENVRLMSDGTWSVRDRDDYHRELASFERRAEAEAFSRATDEGRQFVAEHPAPPYEDTPAITAGTHKDVLTYADAIDMFAYDEINGRIYHRYPHHRRGQSAIQTNDRNRPFLRAHGRQYPAGMMAWFMTHGVWPKRKQIGYHDHDPRNIALANLYLKG